MQNSTKPQAYLHLEFQRRQPWLDHGHVTVTIAPNGRYSHLGQSPGLELFGAFRTLGSSPHPPHLHTPPPAPAPSSFTHTPRLFWKPKMSPARGPCQPSEPPSPLILQSFTQAQILPAAHEFPLKCPPLPETSSYHAGSLGLLV